MATIVLRARAAETSLDVIEAAGLQDAEESTRERWARLGITVNELALPALCLNLPGLGSDAAYLSPGEPVHLSMRALLRRPPTWHAAHRDVFACENPNIVAIAAGARLRYHGDFDWAGLVISNFVMREFGAEPWLFGTVDYLSATADHKMALRGDKPVAARWDDRLAGAMSERRVVVHEEGVVETLLMDLGVSRPG